MQDKTSYFGQSDEFNKKNEYGLPQNRSDQQPQSLYETYQQKRQTQNQQYYGQQSTNNETSGIDKEGVPSLSLEDMRLLRQCNTESFYKRCLPLAVAGCAILYTISKQRNMTPSPWNYMATGFAGWLLGKFSYRKICEDKLVNSGSNSPLVKAIRRRRGMITDEFQSGNKINEDEQFQDWQKDSKGYGASEFADEKEDSFPNKDDLELQEPPKYSVTYDDLRAKNRSGYRV